MAFELNSRRPLLDVRGLEVSYRNGRGDICVAVCGASLRMARGEIVSIFGASGSGKTSLGLALINLLPRLATRSAQMLDFQSRDLLAVGEAQMRKIRGKEISIMYQEPALALNPVMRVGEQIAEVIRAHKMTSEKECRERVLQLLLKVGLDKRSGIYNAYPHELSGGERHRIVIAQAVACCPLLVIADEPTAGLDAELKPEIMDLIERLRTELSISFLVISHDRKMLARIADRTLVMSEGRLADHEVKQVCSPRIESGSLARWSSEIDGAECMVIRGVSKSYTMRGVALQCRPPIPVLRNVNLAIRRGSSLGLVGRSGSGKSTLARCLALWEKPDTGQIYFGGRDITNFTADQVRQIRPVIQLVLQDSADAFNPALTLEEIVEEPLLIQNMHSKEDRRYQVAQMLEEVGIGKSILRRKPLELSGGQRQRLAIARALIASPEFVIFDESTTALDDETRAEMVSLLWRLRRSRNLTYLVISHDLEALAEMVDEVAVMEAGTITATLTVNDALRGLAKIGKKEVITPAVNSALISCGGI